MSEIGSGSGSSYPGALDTNTTQEVNSPNAGKTKARAEVPNDLAACVVALETELGTDPAGTLTDVKTFLQTEHATNGTHTTDVISEKTAGSGVTVDSVLLKDNTVTATTITANTSVVTDTISEKTATNGVAIDGLTIKDGGISDGTNIIKTKIINIGDWNMDADASKAVAHGLTIANIRYVTVMIRNDAATEHYPINYGGLGGGTAGGYTYTDATNINLVRIAGTAWDSTNYDSTSYNRGWITITYVV